MRRSGSKRGGKRRRYRSFRRDQKTWLKPKANWRMWKVYTLWGEDRTPRADDYFLTSFPPNPSDGQLYEQLLRDGHIVFRRQRSSYRFDRSPLGGSITVLLNGRPEYLLDKVD